MPKSTFSIVCLIICLGLSPLAATPAAVVESHVYRQELENSIGIFANLLLEEKIDFTAENRTRFLKAFDLIRASVDGYERFDARQSRPILRQTAETLRLALNTLKQLYNDELIQYRGDGRQYFLRASRHATNALFIIVKKARSLPQSGDSGQTD